MTCCPSYCSGYQKIYKANYLKIQALGICYSSPFPKVAKYSADKCMLTSLDPPIEKGNHLYTM